MTNQQYIELCFNSFLAELEKDSSLMATKRTKAGGIALKFMAKEGRGLGLKLTVDKEAVHRTLTEYIIGASIHSLKYGSSNV